MTNQLIEIYSYFITITLILLSLVAIFFMFRLLNKSSNLQAMINVKTQSLNALNNKATSINNQVNEITTSMIESRRHPLIKIIFPYLQENGLEQYLIHRRLKQQLKKELAPPLTKKDVEKIVRKEINKARK